MIVVIIADSPQTEIYDFLTAKHPDAFIWYTVQPEQVELDIFGPVARFIVIMDVLTEQAMDILAEYPEQSIHAEASKISEKRTIAALSEWITRQQMQETRGSS